MAVPSFVHFVDPLLRFLAAQREPVFARTAHEAVADRLGLTATDRTERVPSGQQPLYTNRCGWAHDRLKRAGLSRAVRRGAWEVTEKGRLLILEFPTAPLPEAVLRTILSVVTNDPTDVTTPARQDPGPEDTTAMSPTDRIESAVRDIRGSVAADLLDQIGRESPAFFERLVLDLLHAMGYGTSRAEIQSVGRSGDGGIDGIISLDRLGLQKVYVQAKRWQGSVGSPVVRDFIGALSTHQGADKGVLFTLSSFTADAHATAANIRSGTVVLIDGKRLVELMIDNRVGVTHLDIQVPRIDSDYFEGSLT